MRSARPVLRTATLIDARHLRARFTVPNNHVTSRSRLLRGPELNQNRNCCPVRGRVEWRRVARRPSWRGDARRDDGHTAPAPPTRQRPTHMGPRARGFFARLFLIRAYTPTVRTSTHIQHTLNIEFTSNAIRAQPAAPRARYTRRTIRRHPLMCQAISFAVQLVFGPCSCSPACRSSLLSAHRGVACWLLHAFMRFRRASRTYLRPYSSLMTPRYSSLMVPIAKISDASIRVATTRKRTSQSLQTRCGCSSDTSDT